MIRAIGTVLIGMGFDPRKTWAATRALPTYLKGYLAMKRQISNPGKYAIRIVPTLSDLHAASGVAKGHYFHQDLWAAREIFKRNPLRHVDVGSRVDGFVAHVLSFREIEVVDFRKLESKVQGLSFMQANMMDESAQLVNIADSVSCLHALEHFGLGRYGDPIDTEGWRKGVKNVAAVAKPEAYLYLSVPVGRPAIEFNAQRIFDPADFVDEAVKNGLELVSFSMVDDAGDFYPNAAMSAAEHQDFACGCFVFKKLS